MRTEDTSQAAPIEPGRRRDPDRRWFRLQGSVAVGMILALITTMAITQEFIRPFAVEIALFGIPLALMPARPRVAAIWIGIVSTLRTLFSLLNPTLVDDLTYPADTGFFILAVATVVLPLAGVIGLVGVLRRASGRAAGRTLQGAGALVLIAIAVGIVAGVTSDEQQAAEQGTAAAPVVVLERRAFRPGALTVPAGTTVTWAWPEGSNAHNVVGDGFSSPTQGAGTFAHRFAEPGSYAYACTLHPGMEGTVTVTPAGSPSG
jgi:plastocyanin